MPGAGALDRRVVIQAAVETPDASGQPVKTWIDVATVWGHRHDVSGNERFRAQQTLAERTALFTIRYRDGLTPDRHRLVEGGLVWDITGVAERGRRHWLEITAEAKVV